MTTGRRFAVLAVLATGFGGCDAVNPAFVSLFDPTGTGQFSTLDNAPGHLVVAFVNNAEVDERLLTFLETQGGLSLSDEERAALRPRMRMRVNITFRDGAQQVVEFVSGSSRLIDQRFDAVSFPDLRQNDLDNVVVICDVATVIVEPGSTEVFIPVETIGFDLVTSTATGGEIVTQFVERERRPPNFAPLMVDVVDDRGNIVVQNNVGIRDVPSPALNPRCGSVIPIVISGTLAVPFDIIDAPSFDRGDPQSVGEIGGRYRFVVTVQ